MTTERRDLIKEAARRRAHCPRCGNARVRFLDGSAPGVGGLPGIVYKHCNACGHSDPTKRKPDA